MDPNAPAGDGFVPPPPPPSMRAEPAGGDAPGEVTMAQAFAEAQAQAPRERTRGPVPLPGLPPVMPAATPAPEPPVEDPARAGVLDTVTASAAARLKAERAEWEQQVAQQRQVWDQQQAAIRQAHELRAWQAEQKRLMRVDLPGYLKNVGEYNDQESVQAAALLWERGEGEPPSAKTMENLGLIKAEQRMKALEHQLQQNQIQLRQYQYEQAIESAGAAILSNHKLMDSLKRVDSARYQAEKSRSMNEIAQTTGRLATADQIFAHAEKRLTEEAQFWAKIQGSPAAPAPPGVQAPKQIAATEAPAALTTGLSAANPQRVSQAPLPDDDRKAWLQAVAEGQSLYNGKG